MNTAKQRTLIGASLSIIVGLLFYYVYWAKHHIRTDNAYLKANMILVTSKVTGFIQTVHPTDNSFVSKGTPLFTIESNDYKNRLQEAQSDFEAQQAHLEGLAQQEILQKTMIDEAKAQLLAREATLKEAQNNLKRIKALKKKGVAADNLYDSAVAKHQNALSALMQAQAQLLASKEKLNLLHSNQTAARAQVRKAEAQVALSKRMFKQTVIKAPFDGVFTNRGVYVGQLVHPALNLAALVEQQHIWLEANYKENQIEYIKPGLSVNISIDAYPDINFKGRVESIAPASGSEFSILPAENATGNFTKIVRRIPVKIMITTPKDKLTLLKAGLSAEASIILP